MVLFFFDTALQQVENIYKTLKEELDGQRTVLAIKKKDIMKHNYISVNPNMRIINA